MKSLERIVQAISIVGVLSGCASVKPIEGEKDQHAKQDECGRVGGNKKDVLELCVATSTACKSAFPGVVASDKELQILAADALLTWKRHCEPAPCETTVPHAPCAGDMNLMDHMSLEDI